MIERRFKSEYDNSYKQIRKVIANYITLLIYAPENFELKLIRSNITAELDKYLKETDTEELCFLLNDIYQNTSMDISYLRTIFGFFFNIIHIQNIESKSSFFNLDILRRNLNLLIVLFERCPLAAEAYTLDAYFNPMNIQNGKQFQLNSYLSLYLSVAPFEIDIQQLKTHIPVNKSNQDIESLVRTYNNKLNEYLNEVVSLIYMIYNATELSRKHVKMFAYQLINFNLERLKMYVNHQVASSIGFLLNNLIVLLKIFFDIQNMLNLNNSEFLFKVIADIDTLFTASNNKIKFEKFDRVNNDLAKEIIDNETEEQNLKDHNYITEIFFIVASMVAVTVKSFDDEFNNLNNKYDELNKANSNDPLV